MGFAPVLFLRRDGAQGRREVRSDRFPIIRGTESQVSTKHFMKVWHLKASKVPNFHEYFIDGVYAVVRNPRAVYYGPFYALPR